MRLSVSGLPTEPRDDDEFSPADVNELAARALGRFSGLIEAGDVRFGDINGPKGGVDASCRIRIALVGGDVLRASATTESFEISTRHALQRIRRLLARRRERRVTDRTRHPATSI